MSESNYVNAIKRAGAIPTHEYLPKVNLDFDGLLLAGGADIHPKYYGQDIDGSVNIDQNRDTAEYQLFNAYLNAGKPIFGICRGCQIINVFLGGSLIQHIDCHQRHTGGKFHAVSAKEGSLIGDLHGREFISNSYHHQAVKDLGKGLKATAWSEDGKIVEAIEHENLPIFAVQWHPERMIQGAPQYEEVMKAGVFDEKILFEKFIEICKKYKGK